LLLNVTCNQSTSTNEILFVCNSFPWSKPDLVRKWEHAMNRKEFKATIHSRVCSNHFTPDCFDRTGQRVKIKAGE